MRAQDVTEYFSLFHVPSLAIGWAKMGFAVESAKSWARACFSPTEAQEWMAQGFNPKDAILWSYSKIAPELYCKLK
ncbi:hypothetical protein DSO57_1039038 [Entomophthora muscae]|uniref:Uncharacterized protein n=1 Tax=Entomophthora muscae TaxID=34485 RepID=A0ACC2RDA0_9FUNG|nr:hypothetical protein DSO57_1039038 [Entomophthora muscae]